MNASRKLFAGAVVSVLFACGGEVDVANTEPEGTDSTEAALIQGDGEWDYCDRYPDRCTQPSCYYSFVQNGNVVCHLDKDTHWDGVTIEFWGIYVYANSCTGATAYRKYKVTEVYCGWSASSCETKVRNKAMELAAHGIYVTVQSVDNDQCPYPRI